MALSTQILHKIEESIDKEFYAKGEEAGKYFYKAFKGDGKTQANNLKVRAFHATRFTEIISFVKNQVGKEKKGEKWLYQDKGHSTCLGIHILEDLEKINKEAESIAGNEKLGKPEKIEIALRLARGYIDALVVNYLYLEKKSQ